MKRNYQSSVTNKKRIQERKVFYKSYMYIRKLLVPIMYAQVQYVCTMNKNATLTQSYTKQVTAGINVSHNITLKTKY